MRRGVRGTDAAPAAATHGFTASLRVNLARVAAQHTAQVQRPVTAWSNAQALGAGRRAAQCARNIETRQRG
jgi:hypothetical protein